MSIIAAEFSWYHFVAWDHLDVNKNTTTTNDTMR